MTEGVPVPEAISAVETPRQEPVTFYVGESGLDTRIDEVLSAEEFFTRDRDDFQPNVHWEPVTVASVDDQDQWVSLRNQWLEAAWTPNQSSEERTENSQKMRQVEEEMRELENKANKAEQGNK